MPDDPRPNDPRPEIRPQKGPQEAFLSTPADIAIYGGGAGGGKTYALLLEPLRHVTNKDFGAVVFRRESTQITNEGGLWDEALGLYPGLGAEPRVAPKLVWRFPSGARVTFSHLHSVTSVLDWQGAQIPLILFDELTHFERSQFFYMLSRNRSTCGVRPYVRATTNPDADSWVAEFIAWWIDQETGLPIPERAGVLRWFVRVDDTLHWGDSREELVEKFGCDPDDPKSVTFIPASVHDNPALLSKDPGYLSNLKALTRVERERLLGGNWKVRPSAGMYFARGEANLLASMPDDIIATARAWDLAGTEPTDENPDPDWTVGLKLGRRANGRPVVLDVKRVRQRNYKVRQLMRDTAEADGKEAHIAIPKDPGQAGKDQSSSMVEELGGFIVQVMTPTGSKVVRAGPVSAQWQAGNIDVAPFPGREAFLAELEAFPDGAHDDQVDALGDAYKILPTSAGPMVAGAWSTAV